MIHVSKKIFLTALLCSVLFLFILVGVWNYSNPVISHATSTKDQINGTEIEWFYELERQEDGAYVATHVYTNDTTLTGEIHIPHTLNGYPVVSIGRGLEKNPVIPSVCKVTRLSIPDSVHTYEDYAFYQLADLSDIFRVQTMAQTKKEPTYDPYYNVLDSDTLTKVGYRAFFGCKSLTCMYVPDRTFTIGDEAFADCSGIQTVFVGNQALLGTHVFRGCDSLMHLEIDQTEVGNQFQDCQNLAQIVFGKQVRRIQADAFSSTEGTAHVLTASSIAQQYIYHNNEITYESAYDAQKVTNRELYFLNPDTVIEHQVLAWKDTDSFEISHSGMLFPHFSQSFHGEGTGSITVQTYYNYELQYALHQTYTRSLPKIRVVTDKQTGMTCNITDFDVTADSVTANQSEGVSYSWSSNSSGTSYRVCYPQYSFPKEERLNICDFYQDGIAKNQIYVTGDATRTSAKSYDEQTHTTSYELIAQDGGQFLENSDLQNWWHDYCRTQKISEQAVPSYLDESQYVESAASGKVRYIKAYYQGSVQAKQAINPKQLKLDICTYSVGKSRHLTAEDSRVFYIKKEDLRRQSSGEAQLFADKTMDYYQAYSPNRLGFDQEVFDYRYYDYSGWQRFFHVADLAENDTLSFLADSTNQFLSIEGMNQVIADELPDEAVEGTTELYVFYIAGFEEVGAGGTFEKENTKYLPAITQEDGFGEPKKEGLFDENREYVGLGGSYRYDAQNNRYIYDVNGTYAPVICLTTCQIYTTPANASERAGYEKQIEDLKQQLLTLQADCERLNGQVGQCDDLFASISEILGNGYSDGSQLTFEEKMTEILSQSKDSSQKLQTYQDSLLSIAQSLNELAKQMQKDPLLETEKAPLSIEQIRSFLDKTNQLVISTETQFEQLCEKIQNQDAAIQLIQGIAGALKLAKDSSNEQILQAVTQLYRQNDENQKSKEELQTQLQQLQPVKTENETLKNEKQTLKTENETLKSEKQTLKTENETLKSEKQTLKTENESLRNENTLLKSENQSLKKQRDTTNQTAKTPVSKRSGQTSVSSDSGRTVRQISPVASVQPQKVQQNGSDRTSVVRKANTHPVVTQKQTGVTHTSSIRTITDQTTSLIQNQKKRRQLPAASVNKTSVNEAAKTRSAIATGQLHRTGGQKETESSVPVKKDPVYHLKQIICVSLVLLIGMFVVWCAVMRIRKRKKFGWIE